jgi:hypothetical protein
LSGNLSGKCIVRHLQTLCGVGPVNYCGFSGAWHGKGQGPKSVFCKGGPMIDSKLCAYIADYIQEELTRGIGIVEIDKYMIFMAIEAYQGGAAIGANDEE